MGKGNCDFCLGIEKERPCLSANIDCRHSPSLTKFRPSSVLLSLFSPRLVLFTFKVCFAVSLCWDCLSLCVGLISFDSLILCFPCFYPLALTSVFISSIHLTSILLVGVRLMTSGLERGDWRRNVRLNSAGHQFNHSASQSVRPRDSRWSSRSFSGFHYLCITLSPFPPLPVSLSPSFGKLCNQWMKSIRGLELQIWPRSWMRSALAMKLSLRPRTWASTSKSHRDHHQ